MASIEELTTMGLSSVPDAFRLFPLPGIEPPEPSNWGNFLQTHPQYVTSNGHHKIIAINLADKRGILEGMSEDYQRLGATLISVLLNEEELLRIAEGTYWNT